MYGTKRLLNAAAGLAAGFAVMAAFGGGTAFAVEIPVVSPATQLTVAPHADYGTTIQSANMALAGTPTISTVILTDTSGGNFGDPGMFSGYDLDAVYLDRDGNPNTTGDRFFATSIGFTPGAVRAGAPLSQTSFPDEGPLFGLVNGSVAPALVTLDAFDGVNIANRDNADGFLTFGDGGVLVLTFANIDVAGGLFLLFGEVGGQGESLRVEVPGQVPLPGAVWLFLSAIAVLLGISRRRNTVSA